MEPLTNKEFELFSFLADTRNWRHPAFSAMRKQLKHQSDGYIVLALRQLKKKGYIGQDYKPLKHSENNTI